MPGVGLAFVLALLGLVVPSAALALSFEAATPEFRPRPAIWFALESTLPTLPAAELHFGSGPIDLEAPVTEAVPKEREVLRTGYQSEGEDDLRAAAARALLAVGPASDEPR